jgi:hypothetical protein
MTAAHLLLQILLFYYFSLVMLYCCTVLFVHACCDVLYYSILLQLRFHATANWAEDLLMPRIVGQVGCSLCATVHLCALV